MENIDGHEGAQANQPSCPISRRRQREEQDSNQSDQRRRVDETSATEDNNNNTNSSSLSISQENRERLIEQAHLEDAIHDSDNNDDETEEEESTVSTEGWNSNQSNQSRRVDETAATEDGNNSSSTSFSLEDLERYAEEALQIVGQMDVMQNQMENDDDETEEEESSVSNGNNSSSTSFSLEDAERYVEESLQIAGQMDVMQNQMEEEESSVSNEGWNSNQSSTEDGNNNSNSSSASFSQEDIERLAEQAVQVVRWMDAAQDQQGTIPIVAVGVLNIDNADGSVRTMQYTMRFPLSLNIDGMSYEELTALEERIGIVKTGLSKDIILKQLKTRVHTTSADLTQDETDICTVCQDGYENQDKIATLGCKHEYHQDCITKWLVRKNLCPICKGQALKTMEESKKEEVVNEC